MVCPQNGTAVLKGSSVLVIFRVDVRFSVGICVCSRCVRVCVHDLCLFVRVRGVLCVSMICACLCVFVCVHDLRVLVCVHNLCVCLSVFVCVRDLCVFMRLSVRIYVRIYARAFMCAVSYATFCLKLSVVSLFSLTLSVD